MGFELRPPCILILTLPFASVITLSKLLDYSGVTQSRGDRRKNKEEREGISNSKHLSQDTHAFNISNPSFAEVPSVSLPKVMGKCWK